MVLTINDLNEILDYLETSLSKLAQETQNQTEFEMEQNNISEFLSYQFDIRLDNLLQRKNSNIHHLESGMKNQVIQRKQKLLEKINSKN